MQPLLGMHPCSIIKEGERVVLGNLEGRGGISPVLMETEHSLLIDPSLGLERDREILPCKNHIDSLQTEPTLLCLLVATIVSVLKLLFNVLMSRRFCWGFYPGLGFPLAAIDEFKEASQRTRWPLSCHSGRWSVSCINGVHDFFSYPPMLLRQIYYLCTVCQWKKQDGCWSKLL